MYPESQQAVSPEPSQPDTDGEPSTVLIRLFEELDRDEEKSPGEITRVPMRQNHPTPRPFAHD
jgi:hypothetical protein